MSTNRSRRNTSLISIITLLVFFFQNCGQQPDIGGDNVGGRKPSSLTSGTTSQPSTSNQGNNPAPIPDAPAYVPPKEDPVVIPPIVSDLPDELPQSTTSADSFKCVVNYIDQNSDTKRLVRTVQSDQNPLEICAYIFNQLPKKWTSNVVQGTVWERQNFTLIQFGEVVKNYDTSRIPARPKLCVITIDKTETKQVVNLNDPSIMDTVTNVISSRKLYSFHRMEKSCADVADDLEKNGDLEKNSETIASVKYAGGEVVRQDPQLGFSRNSEGGHSCTIKFTLDNKTYTETQNGDDSFTKDQCMNFYVLHHNLQSGAKLTSFSYEGFPLNLKDSKGNDLVGAKKCTITFNFPSVLSNSTPATPATQTSVFYFPNSCDRWKTQVKDDTSILNISTTVGSQSYTAVQVQNTGSNGTHAAAMAEVSIINLLQFTNMSW